MSINRYSLIVFFTVMMLSFTNSVFANSPIIGVYENIHANTKNITKVIITCEGKQLFIETFVKCKNQVCNWKKVILKKVKANEYQAIYKQGFAQKKLFLQYKNKQLIIRTKRTYKDSRPTSEVVDTLKLVKSLKKC